MHIQNQLSVYLHYSQESKMQYPRFYILFSIISFNSKVISNTWLDPRGGNVLRVIAYLLHDYSNQN